MPQRQRRLSGVTRPCSLGGRACGTQVSGRARHGDPPHAAPRASRDTSSHVVRQTALGTWFGSVAAPTVEYSTYNDSTPFDSDQYFRLVGGFSFGVWEPSGTPSGDDT
eukprot:1826144-Prymnesium_polylepis.2